jgi:hypothetical protein
MRINKFDFQVGGLVVDNSHKDEEELKKELSKNGYPFASIALNVRSFL